MCVWSRSLGQGHEVKVTEANLSGVMLHAGSGRCVNAGAFSFTFTTIALELYLFHTLPVLYRNQEIISHELLLK